jgi:hypothetical protein
MGLLYRLSEGNGSMSAQPFLAFTITQSCGPTNATAEPVWSSTPQEAIDRSDRERNRCTQPVEKWPGVSAR